MTEETQSTEVAVGGTVEDKAVGAGVDVEKGANARAAEDIATEDTEEKKEEAKSEGTPLPTSDEMKEIIPDLCDSGVEHMKTAKLSKEQIKYLSDYVNNYQKGQDELLARDEQDFVKNISKEQVDLVGNYVNKVMGNGGKALLEKYSHDKDFYNFVKKQVESTQGAKLVKSDAPNTLSEADILKQIKAVREDPSLYDDFSNQKDSTREKLTGLYRQLGEVK